MNVREPEDEHVLNRSLPEVVVDPEDRRLRKLGEKNPVQGVRRAGRFRGFLDDDAGASGTAGAQLLDDLEKEPAGSPGNGPAALRCPIPAGS
jgi:hypothetical protein